MNGPDFGTKSIPIYGVPLVMVGQKMYTYLPPENVCKALSSACITIRFSKSIPTYPPSDGAFPPKINTYLPLSSWAHSHPTQGYSQTLR